MESGIKGLPRSGELRSLASQVRNYPITGLGIVQHAEHLGYDDATIKFLKLFSKHMVFACRKDFLEYCILLKRLLKEEYKAEEEHLRSPQD